MADEQTTQLSERELEVLKLVATGASNQQIAQELFISVNTVKVHLRNIFGKLDVQSRTEAARKGIEEGFIILDDAGEVDTQEDIPAKTYLVTPTRPDRLPLTRQIYFAAAMLLALLVLLTPVLAQSSQKPPPNRTELPVIFSQSSTPTPVNNDSNPWVIQDTMPTKRAGLGVVLFEGRIFAIGGVREHNRATPLVEIYDPFTNKWIEGAGAKPTAVANITPAVLNNQIYVPGGCANTGQAMDVVEIYDPQADRWQIGPPLPEPRCAYGLVAFEERLYLFGGWDGNRFRDTIFVFSPRQAEWQILETRMPQAKGYFGATVLDEAIYIGGGYDGEQEFAEVYAFLPATGSWIEKRPMQVQRGGLSLLSNGKYLYAIGGGWDREVLTSERYDPLSDTWITFETPFNHAWRNMGMTVVDNKIYGIGGWNNTEEQFMNAVVYYQFLYQLFIPAF